MNIYVFRDGDGDEVIVSAVSQASAEAMIDREVADGRVGVAFTNGTRVHIPVDDVLNVYTGKQVVRDETMNSERVLFELD